MADYLPRVGSPFSLSEWELRSAISLDCVTGRLYQWVVVVASMVIAGGIWVAQILLVVTMEVAAAVLCAV